MPAAYCWYLSLRWLLTRRVNVLGALGVGVAVWAMIVVLAVFAGFIGDIRDHVRSASAELLLTGVQPRTSYAAVRPVLERHPDVLATAPRLQHYAIYYARGSAGKDLRTRATETRPHDFDYIDLVGIDPQREARTTDLRSWVENVVDEPDTRFPMRVADVGAPLAVPPERRQHARELIFGPDELGTPVGTADGVLLGVPRFRRGGRLMLVAGQRLELLTARFERRGDDEQVRTEHRTLPVAGAFQSRHQAFDQSHAFLHIDTLRSMLGHDPDSFDDPLDLVTEVAIRARPGADLAAVAGELGQAVAGISGGRVQTWQQQNATYLAAVETERRMMGLVLFAVMVVAAFLIHATLHVTVSQKVRDIGILTALGATGSGVQSIFLISGGIVALLGCAAGTTAGIATVLNLNALDRLSYENFGLQLFPTTLYAMDEVPHRLEPGWLLLIVTAALAVALLFAWLPARRAGRLEPVAALAAE